LWLNRRRIHVIGTISKPGRESTDNIREVRRKRLTLNFQLRKRSRAGA
jgi:hypothetical protein